MNHKILRLLICIGIPLGVGGLSAWITKDSMDTFGKLVQPPLSPPSWLFPVVWTILFILMGIASYLIATQPEPQCSVAKSLRLYAIQLGVNFLWSILFFNFSLYLPAFLWLLLLWALILITTLKFYKISTAAAGLMLPYLLWVTFAGYLNMGIYLLN